MLDWVPAAPIRIWVLLLVGALGPALVAASPLARARTRIANRLATRTMALVGAGVSLLAAVATLSLLNTGLQEIQRRHTPSVVELARVVRQPVLGGYDTTALGQALAVFRLREGETGPVAAWFDACGQDCLTISAGPAVAGQARSWASRLVTQPPPVSGTQTVSFAGGFHLMLPSALRDEGGLPVGRVVVTVSAEWVADRAFRTAALLLALGYAVAGLAWWLTRRTVSASVADRVHTLMAQVEAADRGEATGPVEQGSADELALLSRSITDHVSASVDRQRRADEQAADARALAARIQSTTTLAAGVAHDFNNLMMGVSANSEVLRLYVGEHPKAHEVLKRITDCAERGGKLAQQMLAFARGGKYNPTVLDLNETVRSTLEVSGDAPASVMVRTELAPDLARVRADPTQMNQVVANLYRNAVEAITRPGEITITTANHAVSEQEERDGGIPAGEYVRLSVRDTGGGMSATTRARIFEPFFTTKAQGRGMGLPAVYGIVSNHGGHIRVVDPPGGGTELFVYLPMIRVQQTSQPIPTPRSAERPPTVLLVDDEPVIVAATVEILELAGYTVLVAENGVEAVHVAREAGNALDVVVLDMRMPVMTGAEAFPSIVEACPDAKVIISSGYELDQEAQALLRNGAVGFLRKPFTSEVLIREIRRAMAGKPSEART